MYDRTVYGHQLKILTVVDEYTRESLEIRVEKRMRSNELIETLDELMQERPLDGFDCCLHFTQLMLEIVKLLVVIHWLAYGKKCPGTLPMNPFKSDQERQ